jgi:glyoxylate carboligase
MIRRSLIAAALLAAIVPAAPVPAHHGWGWATDDEFAIAGIVRQVRHGNPHGTMLLATSSGVWTVEIGQPWRNAQAGLTRELLKPGTRVLVHGHRSARKAERLVKAERIVIGRKSYNLYPDRPS